MLDEKGIVRKLHDQAFLFRGHMKNRQYRQAMHCYETAMNVAVFVGLDQKERDKLFGVRGEKGQIIVAGEFPENLVIKAMEKTAVGQIRTI